MSGKIARKTTRVGLWT